MSKKYRIIGTYVGISKKGNGILLNEVISPKEDYAYSEAKEICKYSNLTAPPEAEYSIQKWDGKKWINT